MAHREAAVRRDLFPACAAHGYLAGNALPIRKSTVFLHVHPPMLCLYVRRYKFFVSVLYVQTCTLQRILLRDVRETIRNIYLVSHIFIPEG